jgi:hypothetical protein
MKNHPTRLSILVGSSGGLLGSSVLVNEIRELARFLASGNRHEGWDRVMSADLLSHLSSILPSHLFLVLHDLVGILIWCTLVVASWLILVRHPRGIWLAKVAVGFLFLASILGMGRVTLLLLRFPTERMLLFSLVGAGAVMASSGAAWTLLSKPSVREALSTPCTDDGGTE